MSEYTTIWEAVRFGTLKDVIEIFKKGDEKIGDASGDSILFHALANNDSTARYEIANFLINKGADVKIVREDGMSLFFPLFYHILFRGLHKIFYTHDKLLYFEITQNYGHFLQIIYFYF